MWKWFAVAFNNPPKTSITIWEISNILFVSRGAGGGQGQLADKCRINSFTFLELAEAEDKVGDESKDNLSVLTTNRDKQLLLQKIQEVQLTPDSRYVHDGWRSN